MNTFLRWAAAPALCAALVACSKPPPKSAQGGTSARPAPEPVEVSVASVTIAPVDRTIDVTGSLFAFEDTVVSAKLAERLTHVRKDFGDAVAPGEIIAELDRTDVELALEERQAQMNAALARIGLTELPSGDIDLGKLPAVARARAEASNAAAKLDRAKRLFQQSPPLLSEQDFADIRTASEVAANQADVEIMNAKAALAEAKAQAAAVGTARQRLADTVVRAPVIEGRSEIRFQVAERRVSVGEFVSEGTPLFRLVASDPIRYRAQVPDRFSGVVAVGQRAHIAGAEGSQTPIIEGQVSRVWPTVDPISRSFIAEILIANSSATLKPGAFAKGSIVLSRDEGITFVPLTAVWSFAGINRVFAIKDGQAVEHRVQTGTTRGDLIEIKTPLASDQVATSGIAGLSSGAPVRVRATASGLQREAQATPKADPRN